MENYEEIINFLEVSARKYKEKSNEINDLESTIEHLRMSSKLYKAVNTLRLTMYDFENYKESGKIEIPTLELSKTDNNHVWTR